VVVVAADQDIGHYQVAPVLLGRVIMVVTQVPESKARVAVVAQELQVEMDQQHQVIIQVETEAMVQQVLLLEQA
jgi:hypothetical protein